MGDLNAGFRAYVLTRQEAFLHPYRIAHDHILNVGDSIEQMVSDRKPQHDLLLEVQLHVQLLMEEKDSLIQAVRDGHQADALRYVERGRGREIMTLIRQRMDQFNRLEQGFLNRDLAASESKYRSIVDHAPFGIFTTKGMALVFNNRYNRALAGLDPDEEGDPEAIRQSIHPEDRERILSEFSQAVQQNRPYETIFRFLHKDGTVRKVLSRRIPIKDPDGQTMMYQGFNIDITALDQMQARPSRAERLATLGQVAAGITHSF